MNPTVSIRFTASSIRMAPMDDMGIWCFDGFPGEEIIRVHTCFWLSEKPQPLLSAQIIQALINHANHAAKDR